MPTDNQLQTARRPPYTRSLLHLNLLRLGDPTVTEEIIVNGVPRQVTVNLATALRHMKEHWTKIERLDISKLRLWADALCINQDDDTEKLHQVSMMADIYYSAAMVLAWLSSKDEDVSKAFNTFEEIVRMPKGTIVPKELCPAPEGMEVRLIYHDGIPWGSDKFSWLFPPDCSLFNTQDIDTLDPGEPYTAVFNFCQLPFWNRV
ncbi:heterokaryon incompatibility protein-domain-containing protein [Fusarium sp. MPI-SDFR-AT-0072]|nr:heterokaryon incompatibility protein-domain-containing protein [Fusarium sp. MPI-SDFR-AT-0072]